MGRMVLPGEMGFEGFSGLFNRLNDPNAPQPQLASAPISGIPAAGISGIPAAGYADGGNVVGGEYDFESARQMYGLGKLVKKVTKTVKKIAKSPIGKAALLYAGGTYLGGLQSFGGAGFGTGNFLTNLKSGKGIANLFNFGKTKLFSSPFTKTVKNFGLDRQMFNAARTAAGTSSGGLGIGSAILGASALAGSIAFLASGLECIIVQTFSFFSTLTVIFNSPFDIFMINS